MAASAWTSMCLPGEVQAAVSGSSGFRAHFGALASHPYNQEKPDQTIWWLFRKGRSASDSWPAYHLGKYFFDRPPGRGIIRTGIHMEKGIDPRNAAALTGGRGVHWGMDTTWAWHGFLKDLRNGKLARATGLIAPRSGLPVELTVEPSYPLDQPAVHERFGHHRFQIHGDGALQLIEDRPQPGKLDGLGAVRTLLELSARLEAANRTEPWTWVNVLVSCGVPFHQTPQSGDENEWRGPDFWINVLEPLAEWVR